MHEAARAKLIATAMHTAGAPLHGCEGGGEAYRGFHAEMDRMIEHDPFAAPPDPTQPSQEDIDTFNAIAARATRQAN